jgi:uncharacterized protein (DUF1697 family)
MQSYVVLLRAVNLTGNSNIKMADLKALCEAAGGHRVRTYIASGNVVLQSRLGVVELQVAIRQRVEALIGKQVGVIIRTPEEIAAALQATPYAALEPARTVICFLETPPPADALDHVRHRADEQIALGEREVHIHYPSGQGQSKLVVPAIREGTARNLNTVRKLLEMVSEA